MVRAWLVVVIAIGCGPSTRADSTVPVRGARPAVDDPSCPVLVPGTSASVEDSDGGGSLVFVTTGDAAAVRKRAAALAELHAAKPAGSHQMGAMIMTRSTAAVSDVPGGARVTFTAVAPADVGALQSELRMHAQHLATGSCEMRM